VADARGTTTYRLDGAVVMRVAGSLFVVVGIAWALIALTAGKTPLLFAVAALTVVVAGLSLVAAIRPPRILTLSDTGFQVSLVRGAGTAAANWDEVEAVDSRLAAGTASIVLTLTEDRSTAIPLALLGRRRVEAQREIHDRLNDAYGYRHLDAP
jgi:hypothetical protein